MSAPGDEGFQTAACAGRDVAPGGEGSQAGAGAPATERLTYEAATARVEEIIRRLDSGEASLDETLALVSEGKRLIEQCARELAAVGAALEELQPRRAGGPARTRGGGRMSTWERLGGAAGRDRGLRARGAEQIVSSDFERKSTADPPARRRRGGRRRGRHLRRRGPRDPAGSRARRCRSPGSFTLGALLRAPRGPSTCFREPPQREVSRRYRTWAYESAALDLALRQAGTRCTRRSAASPHPYASSSRCASASRRRSSRCSGAWSSARGCASSSTRRARGTTS